MNQYYKPTQSWEGEKRHIQKRQFDMAAVRITT